MKRIFLLCLLCLFCLLPDGYAASDKNVELLIVRGDGYYPPQEMVINDKLVGIHIDLVKEVAATLGVKVKFESYPWKRAVALLRSGAADAITFMSKTPEREKFGIFLDGNKLSKAKNGFFVLKDDAAPLTYSGDLHDLEPYTIGTIHGFAYHKMFEQADYLKRDNGAENETALISKILNHRLRVALGNVSRIQFVAYQEGVLDKILFLKPSLPAIQNYLVFSRAKELEPLANRFAEAMLKFKATPKFSEILEKYGLTPEDF